MTGSLKRIAAHALQLFIGLRRDAFRLMDVVLWPLVLFFSITLFAATFTRDPKAMGLVVMGSLGWRLICHFQMEGVQIFLDNYWYGMTEHLMITPGHWWELVLGGALSALAKVTLVATILLGLGWWIYGFRVERWGDAALGFLACAACGLVFGCIALGVAFLKRAEGFPFIIAFPDAVAVLSGVYYSTDLFPRPLALIAHCLPTTHAFDLLKATLGRAQPRPGLFLLTLVVWAGLGLSFTSWALRKAKRDGLIVRWK
jgi:ABC-2 type transport system permease protein